jgi:serine/threonine protein kinase
MQDENVARRPRAAGRRADYATVPPHVRAWVDEALGSPVVGSVAQVGGMSPGPAARLVLADGRRAFVKAVSPEPNARTPELFRHEIAVLRHLPAADYRPGLVAAYDDGDWVALLLEDVEGRHPDLDDPSDAAAVRAVVRQQAQALSTSARSVPVDTEHMAARVRRWHRMIVDARTHDAARDALPGWWRRDEAALLDRIAALADRISVAAWCHLDVRDDNLLIRPDGRAVILDWGMSCPGPSWLDELVLDLHVVDSPVLDDLVRERPAYADSDDIEQDTTDMLLGIGASLAVMAEAHPQPGLPWLTEFRRREATRVLAGAHRRLSR